MAGRSVVKRWKIFVIQHPPSATADWNIKEMEALLCQKTPARFSTQNLNRAESVLLVAHFITLSGVNLNFQAQGTLMVSGGGTETPHTISYPGPSAIVVVGETSTTRTGNKRGFYANGKIFIGHLFTCGLHLADGLGASHQFRGETSQKQKPQGRRNTTK